MKIAVSWPTRAHNPNGRVNHFRLRAAQKAQKDEVMRLCQANRIRSAPEGEGKIVIDMTFYCPVKRHRDEDNFTASMKGGLDGLASSMGVDDSLFKLRCVNFTDDLCPAELAPNPKLGWVVIHVVGREFDQKLLKQQAYDALALLAFHHGDDVADAYLREIVDDFQEAHAADG